MFLFISVTRVQNHWQNLKTCINKELYAQRRKKYEYIHQLLFPVTKFNGKPNKQQSSSSLSKGSLINNLQVPVTTSETAKNLQLHQMLVQKMQNVQPAQVLLHSQQCPGGKKYIYIISLFRWRLYFMLSLVPSLWKISSAKKIKVKMKFLQRTADAEQYNGIYIYIF